MVILKQFSCFSFRLPDSKIDSAFASASDSDSDSAILNSFIDAGLALTLENIESQIEILESKSDQFCPNYRDLLREEGIGGNVEIKGDEEARSSESVASTGKNYDEKLAKTSANDGKTSANDGKTSANDGKTSGKVAKTSTEDVKPYQQQMSEKNDERLDRILCHKLRTEYRNFESSGASKAPGAASGAREKRVANFK